MSFWLSPSLLQSPSRYVYGIYSPSWRTWFPRANASASRLKDLQKRLAENKLQRCRAMRFYVQNHSSLQIVVQNTIVNQHEIINGVNTEVVNNPLERNKNRRLLCHFLFLHQTTTKYITVKNIDSLFAIIGLF